MRTARPLVTCSSTAHCGAISYSGIDFEAANHGTGMQHDRIRRSEPQAFAG